MIKILVALIRRGQTTILEAAGAAAVVYGVNEFSTRAAWIVAGAAVLLKSLEVDLAGDRGDES